MQIPDRNLNTLITGKFDQQLLIVKLIMGFVDLTSLFNICNLGQHNCKCGASECSDEPWHKNGYSPIFVRHLIIRIYTQRYKMLINC